MSLVGPVPTLSLPTTTWPKSSKARDYPTAKLFNNTACGRAAHHRSFVELTNPNPERVSQHRSLSNTFGVHRKRCGQRQECQHRIQEFNPKTEAKALAKEWGQRNRTDMPLPHRIPLPPFLCLPISTFVDRPDGHRKMP